MTITVDNFKNSSTPCFTLRKSVLDFFNIKCQRFKQITYDILDGGWSFRLLATRPHQRGMNKRCQTYLKETSVRFDACLPDILIYAILYILTEDNDHYQLSNTSIF